MKICIVLSTLILISIPLRGMDRDSENENPLPLHKVVIEKETTIKLEVEPKNPPTQFTKSCKRSCRNGFTIGGVAGAFTGLGIALPFSLHMSSPLSIIVCISGVVGSALVGGTIGSQIAVWCCMNPFKPKCIPLKKVTLDDEESSDSSDAKEIV